MQESKICEDCGTKVAPQAPLCPNCGLSFEMQSQWQERVEDSTRESFPLPPEEARRSKAESIEPQHEYHGNAGFWLRGAALFLDSVLVNVFSYSVLAAVGVAIGADLASDSLNGALALLSLLIIFVLPMSYFAVMESSSLQGTLGKRLVGLKVTDLYGERISFGRALGRLFAKIPSVMILYIGFMMAGWTERKQGLHDMIAGTLVVRR